LNFADKSRLRQFFLDLSDCPFKNKSILGMGLVCLDFMENPVLLYPGVPLKFFPENF